MNMENKVCLINRKNLSLTGIEKVIGINESSLLANVDGGVLSVNGQSMEVKKLDVESGNLEIEGKIDCIKYLDKKEKLGLLKRIFK